MNNPEFHNIDKFFQDIGVGRRELRDSFFDGIYEMCNLFRRIGITVEDDEELCHPVMKEFQCNGPHCHTVFHNLVDYEIHYNSLHRYICEVCKTTKPNARLLEIHVQETHDSFFKVLSQKQSMYQCYVSECNEKFAKTDERHAHCVAVHEYPKKFCLDGREYRREKIKKEPMDGKNKNIAQKNLRVGLNKNQKIKTFLRSTDETAKRNSSDSLMECNNDFPSNDEKDITISVKTETPICRSSLAFVPRQVARKSCNEIGTRDATMQINVLETDSLMELAESLPNCTKKL